MREIKFRAWDKQRNIMIGTDYPDNWDNEKDEWYAEVDYMDLTGIEKISNNERYEVMQFTGLKDKNGVEIYEGDVIEEYEGDDDIPGNLLGTYKVKYIDNGFWLDDRDNEYGFGDTGDMKVIGNIYENLT